MPVSEQTFQLLALEDPNQWELHYGWLRRKPNATVEHNETVSLLLFRLAQQLDRHEFTVRGNIGYVRRSAKNYYIPDVFVIPMDLARPLRGTMRLEVYDAPLPLIVEVWSPPYGEYDHDYKLPEYQQRGDAEIWRIHPYDRTLTAWRRQADGSYTEMLVRGGTVHPAALRNVTIDLDALFEPLSD